MTTRHLAIRLAVLQDGARPASKVDNNDGLMGQTLLH